MEIEGEDWGNRMRGVLLKMRVEEKRDRDITGYIGMETKIK